MHSIVIRPLTFRQNAATISKTQPVDELQAQAKAEAERATAEAKRAEVEAKRAETETKRAEAEAKRATEAVERAELEAAARLAAEACAAALTDRLRALEAQYGIQSPPQQAL